MSFVELRERLTQEDLEIIRRGTHESFTVAFSMLEDSWKEWGICVEKDVAIIKRRMALGNDHILLV